MISGGCPYCDHLHFWGIEGITGGKFSKVICEKCEKAYWLYISRWNPYSLTDEEFNEKYILDENTKSLSLRNPPPPLTETQKRVNGIVNRVMAQMIAKEIIGPAPSKNDDPQ